MKHTLAAAWILLVLTANGLFAQTGNGTVGGIVQDTTNALIPGVTITLAHTGTGVTNMQITNEAGAYSFAAVPPGTYKLTATLPGFKEAVANEVQVGANAQVRYNFTLEVGAVSQQVEVSATPDAVLTESSASVGVLLPRQRVTDLPLVGQNILDLLNVLPGFRAGANDRDSTIGGLSLDTVNATIDGLSTVSSRDSASLWGRQVMTTNVINPDLVGEIRLILSPVDAELGRGNAQIQIQTRSGTNKFAGSAVWNIQNSSLNANTWANKRNPGAPTRPNWYNLNQLTGSVGGPIRKNKTFFFALFDKQMVNRRSLISTAVLTDTARQGIWRYWEGWNPGGAASPEPTSFASGSATPTGTAAAVDFNGNPLRPNFNPTGGAYTLGGLRCLSLFGNVKADGSPFTQADCPGGIAVNNPGPWDPFRTGIDTTGYIRQILALMPRANFFGATQVGGAGGVDGLNIATYRRVQSTHGPDPGSVGTIIGTVGGPGDYNGRNQINLKVDHNFNSKHRLSVNWTYERTGGPLSLSGWGTGLDGQTRRRPQFITVNGTSTLSSTMVNEARAGVNYSSEFATSPWDNLDRPDISEKARKYLLSGGQNPKNGKAYPVLFNPGGIWNGYLFPATGQTQWDLGNYSPLWNYADTLRWTHGKHAISAGGEYRRPETTGYNSSAYINMAIGNASAVSTPQFFVTGNLTNGAAQLPNFLSTGRNNAGTLLNTFNGAINAPNTAYWIDGQKDIKNGTWQDVTTAINRIPSADPYGHQTRTQIGNEFSFFVKDDYKVGRRVTANIGVRYDYVMSPYLTEGLTNRFVGDGLGLFGAGRPASGDPFQNWLTPGNLYLSGYGSNTTNPLACVQGAANPNGIPTSNCDPNLMSTVVFVGPGTSNPHETLVPQSGRFGPALGLSWQVPWFGDKTTIRGGFQRTYGQAGSAFTGGLLSGPGADGSSSTNLNLPAVQAIMANRALNMSDLLLLAPAAPIRPPQNIVFRVGSRQANITYAMYGPNYKTPYTDNWTLSIQRSLRNNMTLELRSVNTLARNQPGGGGPFGTAGTFDLNAPNVYHNPELFKALENTRVGIDDPLFDQMFMGLTLVPGSGAVGTVFNGVLQRGSSQLRRSTATSGAAGAPPVSSALANGNYAEVVRVLLAGMNTTTGLQALPIDPLTGALLNTSQRVLRNGCDRLANGLTTGFADPVTGAQILPRCLPENYLVANPQLNAAQYAKNFGFTNYNAFESQFTLRPTMGITLQATYGFSKTIGQPGNGFTDPLNPTLDYGKFISSTGHDFRTNGTVELPIGPGRLVLANSAGWLARAMEHWQMGFIFQISSGAPRSFLTGNQMLYGNARPNIVGPWDNPKGSVSWNGQNGYFFGDTQYATYQDPQCANVTAKDNLQANCTLVGLAKVVPQGTAGAIPVSRGRYGIPLLENPLPGHQGNLGSFTLNTLPRWAFDANMSKTFQLTESKSLQFRFDATNVFNHPTPADPIGLAAPGGAFPTVTNNSFSDANGNTFGQIINKTGSRTFQGKVRLSF